MKTNRITQDLMLISKLNFMKLPLFAFLLTISLQVSLTAQNNPIKIDGTILDITSNEPIPYATIMVNDKETGQMLTGTSTEDDGRFEVETPTGNVTLLISFMGYETMTITELTVDNGRASPGNISLKTNSQVVDEIMVIGEKSTMEFDLDKRVFNVGSDISSTGVSALEVLNKVPSVNVDIEGQIQLRGNGGVQILINGKPSVLADERTNALGTITADMIESIEVITNPSARYNAEGTAGILNIILKKEEKR